MARGSGSVGAVRRRRLATMLFAAFLALAVGLWLRTEAKVRLVERSYADQTERLRALQAEADRLRLEKARLNDPAYVADLARTAWFWAKDGEIIIRLAKEPEPGRPAEGGR
ncbi:MAG: septum formation initiator family protein [Hydrogenibacillus schlegelii]|nr:septum formation initiator family protein [Hydrogenibacillus schlegelii]